MPGARVKARLSRDLHVALGAAHRRPIRDHGLLRHSRSQNSRNQKARSDKVSRGDGLDSRPGHDPHAHSRGIWRSDQKNKGEKVHGIAQAHGPVAIVTAGAFGAALFRYQ